MKIAEALDKLACAPGLYGLYCLLPRLHRDSEVIEFKANDPDYVVEMCVACFEQLLGEDE